MRRRILLVLGALILGMLLSWRLQKLQFAPPPLSDHALTPGRPDALRYERVICMSPAITEIVFALGQAPRVVGISQFAAYPPEALAKPRCGGFINPNLERILSLRPDILITQGVAETMKGFCADHHIELLPLRLEELDSIFSAVEELGRVLDCAEQAERLSTSMRTRLEAVRRRAEGRPRVRTFLLIGREPGSLKGLMTTGSGFLHEVLELAGGVNIFSDVSRPYSTISKESLLQRRPEVIVELRGEGEIAPRALARIMKTWAAMPTLPAVRNSRIYAIGSSHAQIPGPRVVQLAEELADIIHGRGGQ